MIIALALFVIVLLMLIPAVLSVRKHDATTDDYLTAKHSIHWLPAGISAGVSMLSGFSFTALVGYSYIYGAFAIWFVIVRNIGEILISWYVWPKLYDASIKHNCSTLSQLAGKLYGGNMKKIRIISGSIIVFLLTLYVSSQLQSASIALNNSMDISTTTTILCAATLLMTYCFWGGIRSSIWTDNSQAFLMIITLTSVPIGIWVTLGNMGSIYDAIIVNASADYLNPLTHPDIPHKKLYVFSLLFIGFCILGQPHVFSRFVTVPDRRSMRKAQCTYYVTALTMNLLAVLVGVMVRALISPETFTNEAGEINAESALFAASAILFPLWLVYFIAAGGASAAISTSDSQIQAASTSFIIDVVRPIRMLLLKREFEDHHDWTDNHWATKITTAFIIITATSFAIILTQQRVFDIVEVAWSTQGSLFFAIFVLFTFSRLDYAKEEYLLLFTMAIGISLTLTWKFAGWNIIAYPAMIGMTVSVLLLWGVARLKGTSRMIQPPPSKRSSS